MAGLGAPELIIILLIVMLIFGGSKLPKLARSLGESSKEFRKGLAEGAGDAEPETKSGDTKG
ncbi:MAG TPA: twin-arginine translocase TatA/TatE family subunit [Acidimicrobiia bacterium]|nr:twin-arginine translocase TatA/TatE family subunit [Acidimicrobiia bacterium]